MTDTGKSSPDMAHRPGGFTLVEVLVALTILSLVMLATLTGLRTLASTQVSLESVTNRIDEVRTVSSFLRNAMESAVLGSKGGRLSAGGGNLDATYFKVTRNSVAWKSTILFGETHGGSYLVRVAREDDQLVLRWQEPGPRGGVPDWDKADSRVLVERLEEFRLAYRPSFADVWTRETQRNVIPELVRLQIKSSGRYWPDLIIRVHRSR